MTNLRTVDEINNIFCNNVMAKSRVTRMKLAIHLKQGSDITVNHELFWTELHGAKVHSEHLKNASKRLWPIAFIKSKAILICHSDITFTHMKTQQIIVLIFCCIFIFRY